MTCECGAVWRGVRDEQRGSGVQDLGRPATPAVPGAGTVDTHRLPHTGSVCGV
jgi:hypothetical protein